jgi:hypothetical protein
MQCTQRYLLNLSDIPQCMNCKHTWNREYLESQLTKSFINGELKKHREDVLYEIERALLPATQPYAEIAVHRTKYEEAATEYRKKIQNAQKIMDAVSVRDPFGLSDEFVQALKDQACYKIELKRVARHMLNIDTQMRRLDRPIREGEGSSSSSNEVRRAFIKPCPAADCRGYLSTQWKCGICEVKVCSKCHEIKENEEHVCKPENVATVEAFKKDSKPCPQCGALIQRTEGCSQMFHTPLSGGCGAVFDWNTLKIHTGNGVHNPHWYEYQRHINGGHVPRQLGDVPCGGMPMLRNVIRDEFTRNIPTHIVARIMMVHNAHVHNTYQVLHHYAVDLVHDNRQLRIKFLLNQITETQFKRSIQQGEKARDKKRSVHQIMMMYQTAIQDIMHRFSQTLEPPYESFITEIDELVKYTNTSLEKHSKVYNCKKMILKHYRFETA